MKRVRETPLILLEVAEVVGSLSCVPELVEARSLALTAERGGGHPDAAAGVHVPLGGGAGRPRVQRPVDVGGAHVRSASREIRRVLTQTAERAAWREQRREERSGGAIGSRC